MGMAAGSGRRFLLVSVAHEPLVEAEEELQLRLAHPAVEDGELRLGKDRRPRSGSG
jgi:hypothetical protein